ncbi:hypothetical protein QBC42DRAFT_350843 [Cladorrhinum samala]|uniref:Rhodopsin domain-containing protein n=1 Tax=Cladorrhinum samala TaxID=585594 RepID=A0AAV9H9S4_9PEZI|nr:hypothetical protein QBC42DRAFT_350843 [Cladorrhinum samala]
MDSATPTNSAMPTGNITMPDNSTSIWGPIPTNPGRSLQADAIACAIITWLIACGFVGLRFYTRSRLNNVIGASDWCIIPALVCAAGVTASSLEQVFRGAGKHAWEVDMFGIPAMERAAWYGILFYNMSLVFSRISILLLFRRIFTYRWTKRAIQIVLVLVIAIGIWLVISVCTACVPLEAFWNWSLFWTTKVYCQPGNIWWANAALHVASDLVIMALPMPVLSALKLPRRQKYALVGVFALGFFVCIVSILRIVAMIDVFAKKAMDATYTSAYMIYWTSVEVNASISCACIMTLKPLIQRIFPKLLLSPGSRTGNNGGGNGRQSSIHWLEGPLHLSRTRRESRQSFIAGAGYSGSDVTTASKRKGSLLLGPHVEEYEHAFGGMGAAVEMEYKEYGLLNRNHHNHHCGAAAGFDDLERGRMCSVSTGVAGAASDDDDVTPLHSPASGLGGLSSRNAFGLDGGSGHAGVRAPPKAHMKLAIQVTRSVKVEKFPRSPTPRDKKFEDDDSGSRERRASMSEEDESPGGRGGGVPRRGRDRRSGSSVVLLGRTRTRSV